ncbi:unnamed protein product [Rotaria sp. Silwood1]|nr:unnamed protein product [Rotaria sp. Silwood1]CAF1331306.1 unnamed protein product [Rotaria sp. Silwood1]CAF1332396.1 unnamed protein product [Rotaria sp. Silwood1]CAF3519862.1 unnamed protein product [Rotaria sp. Silwood1]CAF3543448.1 unnamed protein product [Rotaria sp. Silwood1]
MIPSEILTCQFKVNQTGCLIDIRWYLTTNMTGINFLADETLSSPLEHTLRVKTLMSGFGVIQQIEHSFYYFCTTDRCNDANVFKRILESLSLSSQLNELKDLLKPEDPFDGRNCLIYANTTDKSCNITSDIDSKICKQCSTTFTTETTIDTICATCFRDNVYGDHLGEEVLFNMTNQARISSWFIRCRSQGCNGLNIGRQIHNKSHISFDFNKFLSHNTSSKQTTSSSLITIIMIIIAFIIETFY